MPIEKNDEAITTKLPAAMKQQVIALAKQEDINPSVYVRRLIEADLGDKRSMYDSLAEIFKDANGNMVSDVSQVTPEKRVSFMRLVKTA